MSVLIKGGRVITAADDYVGDLYVEGERISLIGETLDVEADKVVDATGKPLPAEAACLSGLASDLEVENPRDNWLVLHASEAGTYRIGAPYKVPRGSACP